MEVIVRRISTLSDDLEVMIDLTVSTVSAASATCLDQGLELAGNSLSVGTNVES